MRRPTRLQLYTAYLVLLLAVVLTLSTHYHFHSFPPSSSTAKKKGEEAAAAATPSSLPPKALLIQKQTPPLTTTTKKPETLRKWQLNEEGEEAEQWKTDLRTRVEALRWELDMVGVRVSYAESVVDRNGTIMIIDVED